MGEGRRIANLDFRRFIAITAGQDTWAAGPDESQRP
jgi:hypothetical protein